MVTAASGGRVFPYRATQEWGLASKLEANCASAAGSSALTAAVTASGPGDAMAAAITASRPLVPWKFAYLRLSPLNWLSSSMHENQSGRMRGAPAMPVLNL